MKDFYGKLWFSLLCAMTISCWTLFFVTGNRTHLVSATLVTFATLVDTITVWRRL